MYFKVFGRSQRIGNTSDCAGKSNARGGWDRHRPLFVGLLISQQRHSFCFQIPTKWRTMQISSMFRHWNINGFLCKDMQRLYFQQRNIEPQTVEAPSCPQRQASAWPSSWSRPGPAQTDWFSIDFYRMAFHFVPSKALDRSIKFHMKLTNSLTIKSEYRHHFAPTVVISQIGSTKIYQCSINNHAFPCPRTSIQTLT